MKRYEQTICLRAYMGLGMSDSLKQQAVNGEIVDTGNESYSFNLIEM